MHTVDVAVMLWRVWIKRPCRGCATAFSGLRAARAIDGTIDGTTHEITVALAMTNGTNMRSGTIGAETVRHWAVQCARLQVQQKWYSPNKLDDVISKEEEKR